MVEAGTWACLGHGSASTLVDDLFMRAHDMYLVDQCAARLPNVMPVAVGLTYRLSSLRRPGVSLFSISCSFVNQQCPRSIICPAASNRSDAQATSHSQFLSETLTIATRRGFRRIHPGAREPAISLRLGVPLF